MSQSPVYSYSESSEFVNPSTSINGWGTDQTIPWLLGAGPPEPNYYAHLLSKNPPVSSSGLANLLSSSYSWYGLNNTFNMRGLYMDYAAGNADN